MSINANAIVAAAAACFQLHYGSSLGFVAHHPTVRVRCATSGRKGNGFGIVPHMSYLDDLSPPSPSPDEGNRPKGGSGGGVPAGRGSQGSYLDSIGASNTVGGGGSGIPSGRGPEASYLDILTGGTATPQNDKDEGKDEDEDEVGGSSVPLDKADKPGSWKNTCEYLAKKGGDLGFLADVSLGKDDSRTDVRNLLTQRAIQSFMYLLEECRDPHSAKWIQEDFLESGNLLDFHGTGAGFIERFGGSWDAALLAMMEAPKDTVVVHAKRRGRGHGGWSKNNPFLEERWVEIPITIDPLSLASRIMSVREQIATEWAGDLDAVADANRDIIDSYLDRVRADRDAAVAASDGRLDATAPSASEDDDGRAFRRTAIDVMNQRAEFVSGAASSPFRKGNFDLLYNLCTQASIHRLLREDKAAGREMDSSYVWLRDFYAQRASEYFDGDQPYGRADDFLDEMLRTVPALRAAEGRGKSTLSDPVGAAERILLMREVVVKDWKELMGRVQEDHNAGIRKVMLSKQMRGWGSSGSSLAEAETKEGTVANELGAFE